ncbi:epoxide hydrolase family protein [Microbacterium sp.]|uniref:epoxide hydrolase family protein n=1 Tax=Microbacterium sp. TaxID=51671 RepID=UPI002D7A36F2|nr:alpha/beta fold hydrolase [Microbacterium sp.]HET6302804.1 alpha/beta fold hydrolase [Microbacterium sp.]
MAEEIHRPAPIHVPDADLEDLRERLHRTRWPDPLPAEPWEAGVDLAALRELCRVWADEYDWRRHEGWLNALDPVLIPVDGVELHVFRAWSGREGAIPLLLTHGWPGSVAEFRYVIEPLVDPVPGRPAFDLVMPSLPGFGFGGKPAEPGWGPTRISNALHALMTEELGYERYGVAGGDWGAIVGSRLAQLHAAFVIGFHTNLPLLSNHRQSWWEDDPTERERAALDRWNAMDATGRAYAAIQSTKPQSLTVGQTDSPAGLAAWVLEKFEAWSDGGLSVFHADDLLTNLMFYWAPRSAASSAMIYFESRLDPEGRVHPMPDVPTGVAAFPGEINPVSRRWVEPHYRLVHYSEPPRGGHFAALEQPDLYAADVAEFFGSLPR